MQTVEKPPLALKPGGGDAVAPQGEAMCRRIDSRQLFAAGNELVIDHEGTSYRLRITRQGKLILTK